MLSVRPSSPALQQVGNIVDPDGLAPPPRGSNSRVPATRRDIQHAPPRLQIGGFAQLLSLVHNARGDDGKVATRPSRLLASLRRRIIRALSCLWEGAATDRGHVWLHLYLERSIVLC